jgi:two-component system, chemotaxis family, chemotaxis protein CheY
MYNCPIEFFALSIEVFVDIVTKRGALLANLMIVDDSSFMRSILKDLVTDGGHNVISEAANGKEAILLYENHRPDLVTMDITMPEMDGITAIKLLLTIHPDARVIMVSAMGQEEHMFEAIKAGAKGFLVKPFSVGKVLDEIRFVMNSRQARNGQL